MLPAKVTDTPPWTAPFVRAAVIIAITLIAYIPAMNGGFIWDDDIYVTENKTLTSLDGLRRIWAEPTVNIQYYPLVHTTFWIERHLWGLNPRGFHVNNILLHALNAVLVWLVLRRLGVRGAWLAGAIFAVHPVMVESVGWITERKNVLSGAFYLCALLAYLRFSPIEKPDAPRRWRFYALALILFFCALLSKTVTCSLPAVILLLIWWKRGRLAWRDALPTLPFFAVGAAMGLTTAWLEKHSVGAAGKDFALSFIDRCLIAGRALFFYQDKLLLPVDLTFIYPRWHIDSSAAWQFVFPTAVVLVLVVLWLQRRIIGRGPLAAVLFFAITLFPALGFVDVFPFRYSFVADHFQYLASLGMITLAAAGLARIPRPSLRNSICAATIGLFAVLTWIQCYPYRNLETLWRDTLDKNPDALIAQFNLANLLSRSGRLDESVVHYNEALRIDPEFFEALSNRADVLLLQKKYEAAASDYAAALQLAEKSGQADAVAVIQRQIARVAEAQRK